MKLEDMTLKEVKEMCISKKGLCNDCIFAKENGICVFVEHYTPEVWEV